MPDSIVQHKRMHLMYNNTVNRDTGTTKAQL